MLHTSLWCAGTGTTCTAPFDWECSSAGALQLPRAQLQQFVFCGLQPLSAQLAVPTVMQHIQHTNARTNTTIVQTSASRCTAECSAVQQAHTPPRVYGTVCPSVSKHWHRSVASTGNSSKLSTPATANTTTRLRHSLSLSKKTLPPHSVAILGDSSRLLVTGC